MKKYEVVISSAARKELKKLRKEVIENIIPAIFGLAENPRPQGCKKLKGYADAYRIRIGDYRVVYTIEDDILVVTVVAVRHRKDAYDDL
jgi:mRNA interferase RelE/StbE